MCMHSTYNSPFHMFWSSLIVAVVTLMLGQSTAHADVHKPEMIQLTCQTVGADKTPYFVAELQSDAAATTPKELRLEQIDGDKPIATSAERVVSYKDSNTPVHMVVLVQGDSAWMNGAFDALPGALDRLVAGTPKGSKGALIVYAAGSAQTRYPLGPIGKLPRALGTKADYQNNRGTPLIAGLSSAISLLAAQPGRRVLVLIGDGQTMGSDPAKALGAQGDALRKRNIETHVFFQATAGTAIPDEIRRKDRVFKLATTTRNRYATAQPKNLHALSSMAQTRIANRTYVYFPANSFKLDGKAHPMRLSFKSEVLSKRNVSFCARPGASSEGTTKKGCGCSSGASNGSLPAGATSLLLLGLATVVGTRRRRRNKSSRAG